MALKLHMHGRVCTSKSKCQRQSANRVVIRKFRKLQNTTACDPVRNVTKSNTLSSRHPHMHLEHLSHHASTHALTIIISHPTSSTTPRPPMRSRPQSHHPPCFKQIVLPGWVVLLHISLLSTVVSRVSDKTLSSARHYSKLLFSTATKRPLLHPPYSQSMHESATSPAESEYFVQIHRARRGSLVRNGQLQGQLSCANSSSFDVDELGRPVNKIKGFVCALFKGRLREDSGNAQHASLGVAAWQDGRWIKD